MRDALEREATDNQIALTITLLFASIIIAYSYTTNPLLAIIIGVVFMASLIVVIHLLTRNIETEYSS